ncbi:hypothetical protein M5K25_001100 [Dendrobium thyrsiflorum]|uniref:Uncharacterized protein n=1 Tax=Dendrobium thyrsiflorum TaxID=117978 RepID=A0ABD0W8S7_DENTH
MEDRKSQFYITIDSDTNTLSKKYLDRARISRQNQREIEDHSCLVAPPRPPPEFCRTTIGPPPDVGVPPDHHLRLGVTPDRRLTSEPPPKARSYAGPPPDRWSSTGTPPDAGVPPEHHLTPGVPPDQHLTPGVPLDHLLTPEVPPNYQLIAKLASNARHFYFVSNSIFFLPVAVAFVFPAGIHLAPRPPSISIFELLHTNQLQRSVITALVPTLIYQTASEIPLRVVRRRTFERRRRRRSAVADESFLLGFDEAAAEVLLVLKPDGGDARHFNRTVHFFRFLIIKMTILTKLRNCPTSCSSAGLPRCGREYLPPPPQLTAWSFTEIEPQEIRFIRTADAEARNLPDGHPATDRSFSSPPPTVDVTATRPSALIRDSNVSVLEEDGGGDISSQLSSVVGLSSSSTTSPLFSPSPLPSPNTLRRRLRHSSSVCVAASIAFAEASAASNLFL